MILRTPCERVATVEGYQIARRIAVSMKVGSQKKSGSVLRTWTIGVPAGTIEPSGSASTRSGSLPP